jgi:signal transduction histidine kinase
VNNLIAFLNEQIFINRKDQSDDVERKIAVFIIVFSFINSLLLLSLNHLISEFFYLNLASFILLAISFFSLILLFTKVELIILANISLASLSFIYIPIMWVFSGGLNGVAPMVMFILIVFNSAINKGFTRYLGAFLQIFIIGFLLHFGQTNPNILAYYTTSSRSDFGIIINILYFFIATILIISFFIDKNKRALEEVEAANIRLQKANTEVADAARVQRELISNLSHDLNTPITLISGYAAALKEGLVNEENYNKYLELIEKKSLDLSYLVDDLIELSNLETAQIELNRTNYNVHSLIEEVYHKYKDEILEKGLEFTVSLGDQSLAFKELTIDYRQVQKLFSNLIYNALKHTDKGSIKIKIDYYDKNEILIEVADTGTGIQEEQLPFLFDRFYKGSISRNSEKAGSGLGLHISKKIVQMHGGKIWAENKSRQGANFFFTLPLKKTED